MMQSLNPAEFAARFGPVPDLPNDPAAYTSGHDLAVLLCLARGFRRIVEFGTARGETTLALARANPDAQIMTVDVDEAIVDRCGPSHDLRPYLEVGAAFHGKPEAVRIRQLWTSPTGPHDLALFGGGAGGGAFDFDFAYVDSLHTYEGAKRDTDAARALGCRRIVWDDCLAGGVPELLAELEPVIPLVHVVGTRLVFANLAVASTAALAVV